ncbi:uncharacterized protein NEMAJ01_1764 [Nematocida major]|uniref:uncharacterized protein n=1 Tax=Nematocida major TaxID=1912982 RepID=UPI002007EA9F|nr:uncharacterized protein NEMAJ01_1764 [Nematocida major]KAH9386868.1 hypothetical protein NEMAJ01_1764 [Nematocida major]
MKNLYCMVDIRDGQGEGSGKELNIRVNELANLMKLFRGKVDELEKTVRSLEATVSGYMGTVTQAKDALDSQNYSSR